VCLHEEIGVASGVAFGDLAFDDLLQVVRQLNLYDSHLALQCR
jgi:hypothetical protein